MHVSLFTPTHDPKYLSDAYTSLLRQSLQDWEWVILPNGGCDSLQIPEHIRSDDRVKIISRPNIGMNIGALKRAAVDAAGGDIFIELDHDDMLMPGRTLALVREKFLDGAGFVYSDDAVFRYKPAAPYNLEFDPVFRPFSYDTRHGWQTYPVQVYGHELLATQCFDITPRSLCEIFYCPDHLRAWSRKAYYEAGGHNPKQYVCDDHELIVRTYMSGAKFMHTGECSYLYRMFDHNTVKSRNQQIQQATRAIKRNYLSQLIDEWIRRTGFSTLDISQLRKQGWVADKHLLQGFGHGEHGHIVAINELEWLAGWQVREFMNEAYGALVPGGYLTVIVPDSLSAAGHGDVEWKSQFSAASMSPYTQRIAAERNGNIRCRFQQIDCVDTYPSDWHRDNGFKYLRFTLLALKGQRTPGRQHI